jgi:hypothetical protein
MYEDLRCRDIVKTFGFLKNIFSRSREILEQGGGRVARHQCAIDKD